MLEIASGTGLVAKAPHYYRRMVAVTSHHPGNPVIERRNPGRQFGYALVGVVLKVSLIHHIQSVIVVHRIHLGLIGIVTGADSIDIVPLHQKHILQH